MAYRIYLVPRIGAGNAQEDVFRPAYVPAGIARTSKDYGKEPWMLLWADVTPAQHTAMVAHSDVTAIPANLDATVGGALATVQSKLEAANIPAQWVTAGMTWRTVIKWTLRVILLMHVFEGLNWRAARVFSLVGLDSTVNNLPLEMRHRLSRAAQQMGLNTSGITLATTIRAALVTLGQQMTASIVVNGETF